MPRLLLVPESIPLLCQFLMAGVATAYVAIQYATLVGELVVNLGLVIAFINYAPEPTTVQAKLVGLGLATVLLFVGLASMQGLRPDEIAAEGALGASGRSNGDGRSGDGHRERPFCFDLDLDDAVGTVPVVPEAFVQVVVNLLDNAFYAAAHAPTRPGGPPRVVLRSRRCGDHVEVAVEDTGTGMTAETRAHAFEPFFTTKPPVEGTGLGLSLAYDIVTKSHGGALTVASTPGEGTTFTVRLPG